MSLLLTLMKQLDSTYVHKIGVVEHMVDVIRGGL